MKLLAGTVQAKAKRRVGPAIRVPVSSLLEHRLPLGIRVSKELKRCIEEGQWRGWLPGERQLSRSLCVSRATCSDALATLEREGWIKRLQGVGTKITENAGHFRYDRAANFSIGVVMPHPVSSMRAKVAVWVDELREQLAYRGLRLTTCHSPRLYGPNPSRILATTVREKASACWLLMMTTRATQEWFVRKKIPCLTIGTNFEGVDLPSLGIDLRAIGRHAAGTLIAAGHRSIGFLFHRLPGTGAHRSSAGDLRFAEGFTEESRLCRENVKAVVIDHEETMAGTSKAIAQCLDTGRPCTGLVIASSHCYLSVISALSSRSLKVPNDISLICRDDDHFLDFLRPRPARYCGSWELMLKKMMVELPRILNGEIGRGRQAALFPIFEAGESVRKIASNGNGVREVEVA